MTDLKSSAPHIHGATTYDDLMDWGVQPDALAGASHSTGRLLHKGPGNIPETGIWDCTPGRWRLSLPRDEFCHFVSGRATYRSDDGEAIEVTPGTCVLFPEGWSGEAEVHETIRNIYMLS
ncbi:cupin domain-containing protein [Roseovarius carneus]|uniref:cupin domain-containing protein n=1 Tax=Roseovarius carneus TaxID=2853164 RepID=UPI001CCB4B50|nr:cupin domain-containing protein [Roseovarius carneus]